MLELIDAIVSANNERIAFERAAGWLSDGEAADVAKDLREKVTGLVNSEGPKDFPSNSRKHRRASGPNLADAKRTTGTG